MGQEEGCDIEKTYNIYKETIFHLAVRHSNLEALQYLFKQMLKHKLKKLINKSCGLKRTLLHIAVVVCKKEMTAFFIDKVSNVSAEDISKLIPLYLAKEFGKNKTTLLLESE